MWLTNIGLWLSGAQATVPNQEMGIWADWGMRLPITLLAMAAIGMLYLAASRIFDRRIGLLAAFACMTMPLYAILARQAITDTPFVAFLTIGLCCFCIAEFDPNVKNRDPWLFAFYGSIGLSTLAKEIPFGVGIPGGIILLYLVLSGDWAMLRRVRLLWGVVFATLIRGALGGLDGFYQGRGGGGRELHPPLLAARQLSTVALGGSHHQPQRPLHLLHRADSATGRILGARSCRAR